MKRSFHNAKYVPYVCSPVENNCLQLTPNTAAMGPGVAGYNWNHNVQFNPGHQQKWTYNNHFLLRPVWPLQQTFTCQWGTSTNANLMTVEQTADWIKALCANRGWQGADAYALSFKKNGVRGCILMRLNHEILKFDLDIPNHNHRLFILSVIRILFPFLDYRDVISAPTRLSHLLEDDKNINSRNISLMPGPLNSTQRNHDVLLYPAQLSGGSTCIGLRSVQNHETNHGIRNKKSGMEYCSAIKVGESTCKLDESHYNHFLNMRPKHSGKTVRCY